MKLVSIIFFCNNENIYIMKLLNISFINKQDNPEQNQSQILDNILHKPSLFFNFPDIQNRKQEHTLFF